MSGEVPSKRPSMVAVLGGGEVVVRKGGQVSGAGLQSRVRELRWRQRYASAEVYPLALADGRVVHVRQRLGSEVAGLGTGGTVWPAAYVLARHLEKEPGRDWARCAVLELGAGTGACGLAVAALGAAKVVLTDVAPVLWLARENAATNRTLYPACDVAVAELDWGPGATAAAAAMLGEGRRCFFDVVLVSECVLPQLYPMEPLVKTLAALVGPRTECFVTYEHRTFPAFDPRARFRHLCALEGLDVATLDPRDPDIRADDIELWRVVQATTCQNDHLAAADDDDDGQKRKNAAGPLRRPRRHLMTTTTKDEALTVVEWGPTTWRVVADAAAGTTMDFGLLGGGCGGGDDRKIGAQPWPSSLAAARYFYFLHALSSAAAATPSLRILELGAGCGLLAVALAVQGHAVVATDAPSRLAGLRANVRRNEALLQKGSVHPCAYEWGHDPPDAWWQEGNLVFDVIVCADCCYDSTAVSRLLATLARLRPTALFVANEHRTALDAFVTRLNREETLGPGRRLDPISPARRERLWALDSEPPARQPSSIALFASTNFKTVLGFSP